jgi:hypothetical protein
MSGGDRENLRRATWRAMSSDERMLSSEGRRWSRTAPSISPSSSPPLPAVLPAALHACHAALRRAQRHRSATGAAVRPWQGPPPPHRSARAPNATLRQQLPREPYPSPLRPRAVRSARAAVRRARSVGRSYPPCPSRVGRHSAIIACCQTSAGSCQSFSQSFQSLPREQKRNPPGGI